MYINLICRQDNRRKKGRSQKLIKFFKVKLITKLKFTSSIIQLYNEFGTILFSAGHALTIHDPFLYNLLLLFRGISQFCIFYISLFFKLL